MKCTQCQSEMAKDFIPHVEADMNRIRIVQKRKGMFKNISEIAKAAVCPNCGSVAFYVENFKNYEWKSNN